MGMKRRTEITIETRRRLIVRRPPRTANGWCDRCLTQVEMITPNDAAALLKISSRAIYRWIEEGQLHFIDDSTGLRVCARSLSLKNCERGTELPADT